MSFPLFIFLIPYVISLIGFCLFCAFALYHLFTFGFWSKALLIMLIIFFTGSLLILATTGFIFLQIDWSASIPIFQERTFFYS